MIARKLYSFTVTGSRSGGFPLDMLRFDSCWPRSQDDAAEIYRAVVEDRTGPSRKRQIRLTSIQEPTEARWASFGWTVINIT